MTYRLRVRTHFDAAHRLMHYEGKCANIHGHTYKVEAAVETSHVLGARGMVVDFGFLKRKLEESICHLDHALLINENDSDLMALEQSTVAFASDPTAETLAKHIFVMYRDSLRGTTEYERGEIKLHSIRVWEGKGSSVEYFE